MQIIIGNLYPHLDTPQPPEDDSIFDALIEIIVVVIVIIVTRNVALISSLISSASAAVGSFIGLHTATVVAAMEAALADAAAQGVAIAMHDQKGFNLTELLTSAAEAAVMGGILDPDKAKAAGMLEKTATQTTMQTATRTAKAVETQLTAQVFATNVLKAGSVIALTQLTEMALGLRKKFDPGLVVAQAVAYAQDIQFSKTYAHTNTFTRLFVKDTIATVTQETLRCTISGTRLSLTSFALNYMNSAAQEIGSVISDEIYKQQNPAVQSYSEASQSSDATQKATTNSPYGQSVNDATAKNNSQQMTTNKSATETATHTSTGSRTASTSRVTDKSAYAYNYAAADYRYGNAIEAAVYSYSSGVGGFGGSGNIPTMEQQVATTLPQFYAATTPLPDVVFSGNHVVYVQPYSYTSAFAPTQTPTSSPSSRAAAYNRPSSSIANQPTFWSTRGSSTPTSSSLTANDLYTKTLPPTQTIRQVQYSFDIGIAQAEFYTTLSNHGNPELEFVYNFSRNDTIPKNSSFLQPDSINYTRGNQYLSGNLSFNRNGSVTIGANVPYTSLNFGSDYRSLIIDASTSIPALLNPNVSTAGVTVSINPRQTMPVLVLTTATILTGGVGGLLFSMGRIATTVGEVATTAIATKTLQYIH